MRHLRAGLRLALLTAALPPASLAWAQSPPTVDPTVAGRSPQVSGPVNPSASSRQLEEIVVTLAEAA